MSVIRSVVLGCGSYLPSRVLTNTELAQTVNTSDEWIVQRTGIHERRTLYSSTEFKKVRLRYFTDEHAKWEAQHA